MQRSTDLFMQRSTLIPYAFAWETIEDYDIKVGVHSKLNEYRKIYMYQRSRSFFDLCARSLIFY